MGLRKQLSLKRRHTQDPTPPSRFEAFFRSSKDGNEVEALQSRDSQEASRPPGSLLQTRSRTQSETSFASSSDASALNDDIFFPLPRSTRFAQASLPFKPEVDTVPGPAAAELEWLPIKDKGRPPTRGLCSHSATRVGNAIYTIGGCDNRNCLSTVRRLDLNTLEWRKLSPTPPKQDNKSYAVPSEKAPKQRAHCATRVHSFIVVYGGGNGPDYHGAVWVFDTDRERWYRPHVKGTPPSPRRAHGAAFDQNKERIYYFGGGNGKRALADLIALDVSDPSLSTVAWVPCTINGPVKPPARGYHSFTQVDDHHAVLYGGSNGSLSYSDCHLLHFDSMTWREINVEGSPFRMSHHAVALGCRLLIFGGHDSSDYLSMKTILEVDLRSGKSQLREAVGSCPSPRGYCSATLHHDLVFCIGGLWADGSMALSDVWALQLGEQDWMDRFHTLGTPEEED